jgi:CBS domain containing-hemolysin-like protein
VGDGITWSNVITGFQVVVVVHSVKRLGSSFYLYTLLDMMLIKKTQKYVAKSRSMALLCAARLVVFFFLRLFWTFLDISSSFCYAIRFIYPLPSHERKGKSTKQGARFDGKLIRNHVMCLKLSLFFCLTALLFSELRSHLMAHQSLVHLDRYAAAVAASSDVLF